MDKPAYVFDEERLTGLVRSAGKLNDVGVEKERSGGIHRGNTRARMCVMRI